MTAILDEESVLNISLGSTLTSAVKSYTVSKRFIKTMLKASVINILYHRLNIDEKEFITKKFRDVSYKSFRSKSKNEFIRQFHSYMIACKDALDKDYMKEFYLYLIDANSGNILENYKFSFQYYEGGASQEHQTTEKLKEMACEILRTLEDLGKHEKLEGNVNVKAELTYFDHTPEEYEPPGFANVQESDSLLTKIPSGISVLIGTLFTGYHRMKCRAKGEIYNFNISQTTREESVVFVDESRPTSQEKPKASVKVHNDMFTEDSTADEDTNADDASQIRMNDTNFSQCVLDISSEEELEIKCPCKLLLSESCSVDKIQCNICKRWYHTPCQGYLDNTFLSGIFKCIYCKGDSDSIVAAFDVKQSMSLYRLRYILGVIYKYGQVPNEINNMFEETLKNFEKLNIFEFDGDKMKGVNMIILNDLFKFDYKMPDTDKFKGMSKTN